ncbi:hypothetical protein ACRALDRAFT_205970 [Sodiomyces alcalophilus JCM 7366]|uniref:uncharacterized protein n=1 Tax=Sodiomyces alcalophilus JCM 7366 TaxID=591952 RepID=UPI0039B54F21
MTLVCDVESYSVLRTLPCIVGTQNVNTTYIESTVHISTWYSAVSTCLSLGSKRTPSSLLVWPLPSPVVTPARAHSGGKVPRRRLMQAHLTLHLPNHPCIYDIALLFYNSKSKYFRRRPLKYAEPRHRPVDQLQSSYAFHRFTLVRPFPNPVSGPGRPRPTWSDVPGHIYKDFAHSGSARLPGSPEMVQRHSAAVGPLPGGNRLRKDLRLKIIF